MGKMNTVTVLRNETVVLLAFMRLFSEISEIDGIISVRTCIFVGVRLAEFFHTRPQIQ